MEIVVHGTWDGRPIPEAEHARVAARLKDGVLLVEVDAPFNNDPPPDRPPGRVDRLWDHEVVELFLLGDDERYLEIELGPHGHYLVLLLTGVRNIVRRALLIEYETQIDEGRWRGQARIPGTYLPANVRRGNAYAIKGGKGARQYHAAFPVPGETPDFHQLHRFGEITAL